MGGESEPAQTQAQEPAAAATTSADGDLEEVVRSWSRALNAGDNDAAADLFLPGAIVIQGELAFRLATHDQAMQWNSALPCSGEIVEVSTRGNVVTAVFVLGHRKASRCDAPPGTRAAAEFTIRGGRIAVWKQVEVPDSAEATA